MSGTKCVMSEKIHFNLNLLRLELYHDVQHDQHHHQLGDDVNGHSDQHHHEVHHWSGSSSLTGEGPINWEMMSMGTGKMMVLLFSAEMLFKVCR